MELRTRCGVCAFVLATASCEQHGAGPEDLRREPSATASASAVPKEPDQQAVRAFLSPFAVHDDKPAQKVLYTWTTEEQVEELTKTKVLLSRSESPTLGPTAYDRELAARPASDAVARLLRNPGFAKKRFAWPSPWATAFGLNGEPYGDRLVRIVLGDDAIVGRFSATAASWAFFDLSGAPVDEKVVLAKPERLAVVLHTSDDGGPGHPAYREYVVCNESRIAEWSTGTEAIEKLLDESADRLESLAPGEVASFRKALPNIWRTAATDSLDGWSPTLAFATDDTLPERARLQRIAKRLRTVPRPHAPVVHHPTRPFVLGSGPTAAPRPSKHWTW